MPPADILILGAAYGLLPGAKLALAGHKVTLLGRADEIAAMASGGLEVRIPDRRGGIEHVLRVPVASAPTPGRIALSIPDRADPEVTDLVILAMQEPQYAAPEVAALLARVGASARPCLSVMNLPPPPFLRRLGTIHDDDLAGVYHSAAAWSVLDPARVSLASPDPQAVRSDPTAPGRLQVTLPSNFKAAPFERVADQALLQRLAGDMSHLKVATAAGEARTGVALLAHRSPFVPLAKWPMLITGNCRAVQPDGMRTIAEAVLHDRDASAAIYALVHDLTLRLGARAEDLVSFESYAKAAAQLSRPSSVARALAAGATAVERIDRLLLNLMTRHAIETTAIEPIVALIDQRIERNRG